MTIIDKQKPESKQPEQKQTFTAEEVKTLLEKEHLFTSIDAALEDAIYTQVKLGKNNEKFINPLLEARNLSMYVLVPHFYKATRDAVPAAEAAKKREDNK